LDVKLKIPDFSRPETWLQIPGFRPFLCSDTFLIPVKELTKGPKGEKRIIPHFASHVISFQFFQKRIIFPWIFSNPMIWGPSVF
jgi:hypothetical protein